MDATSETPADTFTHTPPAVWSSRLAAPADAATLARLVGAWSLETFGPGERFAGHVTHLKREMRELLRAVEAGDRAAIAEEAADVAILLMGLAPRVGFDLIAAVQDKMRRNVYRQWGPPDAAGVIEHVRSGTGDS